MKFEPHKSVHRDDPQTSHDSAMSMVEEATRQNAAVLKAMRECRRPMAAEEISDWMIGALNTLQIMKRFVDLKRFNLVFRTELIHRNRTRRNAYRHALLRQGDVFVPRRKLSAYEKRLGYDQYAKETIGVCKECNPPRALERGEGGWVTLASGETLCGRCYLRRFSTEGLPCISKASLERSAESQRLSSLRSTPSSYPEGQRNGVSTQRKNSPTGQSHSRSRGSSPPARSSSTPRGSPVVVGDDPLF
jgi:hypothetical protein